MADRQSSGERPNRFELLDILRICAALSVVFYHYYFRGWQDDEFVSTSFRDIGPYFRYGYFGVELFFIISGFVIPDRKSVV